MTKAKTRKTRKPAPALKSAVGKKNTAAKPAEKALVKFDPLQRYLTEISTYKLLTREEERELGIRVREKGDKEAAYGGLPSAVTYTTFVTFCLRRDCLCRQTVCLKACLSMLTSFLHISNLTIQI